MVVGMHNGFLVDRSGRDLRVRVVVVAMAFGGVKEGVNSIQKEGFSLAQFERWDDDFECFLDQTPGSRDAASGLWVSNLSKEGHEGVPLEVSLPMPSPLLHGRFEPEIELDLEEVHAEDECVLREAIGSLPGAIDIDDRNAGHKAELGRESAGGIDT
jgi:hypothetical protein